MLQRPSNPQPDYQHKNSVWDGTTNNVVWIWFLRLTTLRYSWRKKLMCFDRLWALTGLFLASITGKYMLMVAPKTNSKLESVVSKYLISIQPSAIINLGLRFMVWLSSDTAPMLLALNMGRGSRKQEYWVCIWTWIKELYHLVWMEKTWG